MQETWDWSLGWEDLLEKEMVNSLQCSCLGNPMDRDAWGLQSMGTQRDKHDQVTEHTHTYVSLNFWNKNVSTYWTVTFSVRPAVVEKTPDGRLILKSTLKNVSILIAYIIIQIISNVALLKALIKLINQDMKVTYAF